MFINNLSHDYYAININLHFFFKIFAFKNRIKLSSNKNQEFILYIK